MINRLLAKLNNFKYEKYLKNSIKNKDFTIICNNCYAGQFYQILNIPYETPTVGLLILAPDYIKFLENLEIYLQLQLEFTDNSKYKDYLNINWPVGILNNDIEIHFMHCKTRDEARQKWNRRKQRINRENFYVIWVQCILFEEDHITRFNNFPYSKKLLLTALPFKEPNTVQIKHYESKEYIDNILVEQNRIRKYIDIAKWINN